MYWLPGILIFPYILLLLKIYRSLLKIQTFEATHEPATFVSVVVACRNEEQNMDQLLKSIACQDYPSELFEVIIVDDNSSDKTYNIASSFKGSGNVLTICNNGTGKKEALRNGISVSSGNLIITTDADCRMQKNWIRTIAAFYEKTKPDMIICPVRIESSPGFFGRFQELEFLSLQGITAGCAVEGNATICNGANLAFTKEAYYNNSNNLHFEIATGDDVFFLHSLKRQSGSRILWLESPYSVVTTKSSPTVISYFRQRRRWMSKVNAYKDQSSILLGIVTFVTILLQITLFISGFFYHQFLLLLFTVTILKSVPDYLILQNTVSRYGRTTLMRWFVPAQLVYPFYVLGVFIYFLISLRIRGTNFPSQKET